MAELIIIILGIAADQLSKAWVSANLYGRSVTILEGVLDYSYVENTGAAFGMLGENTALLAVFSGLMSAVLIYILLRYRKMFGEYMVYVNDKPVLLVWQAQWVTLLIVPFMALWWISSNSNS